MTKKSLLIIGAGLLSVASMAAQGAKPMYKVIKEVTPPNEDDEIVFEIPDGEKTYFSRDCESFKYEFGVLDRNMVKGEAVEKVYVTEDGNVWLSNPLSDMTLLSYVKASYGENESIVIEGPQFIYDEYDDWEDETVKMYLVPMEIAYDGGGATYVPTADMKYVLKKTANGYEAENPELMLGLATYGELADWEGNPTGEVGYAWVGYGDKGITLDTRSPENGVTPPADAVIEQWAFRDPYESALINVAVGDNAIYIQGLDRGVPDAWVKADLADGKATIPSGKYLGINESIRYFSYIWGSTVEYDEVTEEPVGSATDKVVFTYDADAKKLELQDGYAICSLPEEFYMLTLYEKVTVEKQNRNVNTPPSAPYGLAVDPFNEWYEMGMIDFNIPATDKDGNLLDKSKLYYTVYINGEAFSFTPEDYPYLGLEEATTNIPYSLFDNDMIFGSGDYRSLFFDFELPEDNCGVQSMYINEEGKELRSEIVSSGDSGVNVSLSGKTVKERTFFNMQGQAVSPSYNGPVVCRTVYDDGTVKVTKLIRAK